LSESAFPPPPNLTDTPVDPLSTHAASPFIRTQTPMPVAFASPPTTPPQLSTWIMHRSQIEFALAILAYLMVLVGTVVVVQANPTAHWRYNLVALPIVPGGIVLWLLVRWLGQLGEIQKRIQSQALGFSLGVTALMTFGYGFLEGSGLPHLNWLYLVPIEALAWGLGTLLFTYRYR
jgi:hypothetical protein